MRWVLPFLSVILILSGCWDRAELNDVSIITGISIEKGKEAKYKLTVSSINSREFSKTGAQGGTPSTTFSQEGESISELSRKMNIGITRRQIYSHTRILVIDEAVAKAGLVEFLDFLERSGEFRNDFNILIAKDVKASEVLRVAYPLQKDPSMKIHKQAQSLLDNWGGNPRVRLTDFITALVLDGRHPIASTVTIKGDPKKGASVENNQKLDLDAIVLFDGMGVFKNDKLIGTLPVEDVRSYLWTEKLKNTSITVPCDEEGNKFNDLRIISTNSKKQTNLKNGKATLRVEIMADANLIGTHCPDPLTDPKTFDKYEKQAEKFVENDIKSTIKKLQEEYKVDIFGFGESLHRSNPKVFKKVHKEWDRYFVEADVEVKANIFIRRSGIRNDSFLKDLEKLKEEDEE